ncbi:hypothetical protein [Myxococcus stipitatus]|uniref:hypothetical protein n=1 Tax=Myxococcus stipitatus TaxID=83455 RepID=UPI0030D44FFD
MQWKSLCVVVGVVGMGWGEAVASERAANEARACAPGAVYKVKDILPPDAPFPSPWRPVPDWLTNVQGTLYFAADLYMGHSVLWRSDGSATGTVPVKDFLATGQGYRDLSWLSAVGSQLFFALNDPPSGTELWVSDGTGEGTRLVRDIEPGTASSELSSLGPAGSYLTFVRTTVPQRALELWRSDGTAEGTYRLMDFGSQTSLEMSSLPVAGNRLFILSDEVNGTRLWRTDGTVEGTLLVKRLDAGRVDIPRGVAMMSAMGLGVFSFGDGSITEIWRTDGTSAGTVRVDSLGGRVRLLGIVGSHAYVASLAPDARHVRLSRLLLAGGGKEVVATLPNRYASEPGSEPYVQASEVAGGNLYLSVAIGAPSGPAPREVALWVTDGTPQGTLELNRGLNTSDETFPELFDTGRGTLVFSGSDDTTGQVVWVTDGTLEGTGPVADFSSGAGSWPEDFTRVGDTIFFRAGSDVRADALWAMPATVACDLQARPPR